ncbi:MAG: hypothetical protein LBS69_06560, partial [Prevotellaceae bacterium]|nr:hypothetical protein [Prevotellaceae bacterium]
KYNELGQQIAKIYDNNLITDSTKYNIQGWITQKRAKQGANNVFNMKLAYYNPNKPNTEPSYTGNITEWMWTVEEMMPQTYTFSYDKHNRLTGSFIYFADDIKRNICTEHIPEYDKNGNIKHFIRYKPNDLQDNFICNYDGNRLMSITGTKNITYGYDANGNMNYQSERGLEFEYNLLNLPYQIYDDLGLQSKYTYLADGVKSAVIGNDNKGFDYLGSLVYVNDNNVRTFESTNFGGGRINKTSNNMYDINYFITDHLGSTRVIIDNAGIIKEQKDFYPFGKEHENPNLITSTNRYTFSGKEKQTIRDLGYLDFGARMLDAEIGRWFVIDPLAEKYYSISPYVYCMNNPIKYVDPTGMDWYCYSHTYERTKEKSAEIVKRYVYVEGTLSPEEMEKEGYTHLGKTYTDADNNTYYSLGGAILSYDRDSRYSMKTVLQVMMADRGIITTVNSFEGISDFWDKYNEYISTGSNAANAIANFMDASGKFGNITKTIKGIGKGIGYTQLLIDGYSAINGTMTTEGFIDAAVNVISTFGSGYGAGFALMYSQYKKAGKFFINGVNEGERYLRKKFTNPNTYIWGW